MLERIKLLLNITDESKDALLIELIENVREFVLNYTNNAGCLEQLERTLDKMVIYDYSRMGTEGLKNENYSGVSYNYIDGYSDEIMKQLKRFRKVKVI
jgi:hypothetical protein